jgi:hypothetical protein
MMFSDYRYLVTCSQLSRQINFYTDQPRKLHHFIYLFISRDSAIHPKGICGLGKTNEMRPVAGPRPDYHNKVNPPPSAVRCAQVSGYEPPLQENVHKEK